MTYLSILRYNLIIHFTFAPKGANESLENLSAWRPTGMPTIVIQHIAAAMRYTKNISQPRKITHTVLTMGCSKKLSLTFFPNGISDNFANLKHCIPSGIPTTVMHRISPAKHHNSPVTSPPKINHKMFPISFIIIKTSKSS